MPELEGGISIPSEEDIKKLPDNERLQQAAEAAKAAASADGIVNTLKKKAAGLTNPKERERILTEAFNKEIEAKGLSKKARILQSGGFQGAVGGAGIGAATSAGLGTVVGTLVGGVTSIPATLVGGLVGGGVGLFHGPWIKLTGAGKNGEDEVMQVPQQAIDSGAVLVDEKTGSVTVKDPDALKNAAEAAEQAAQVSAQQQQKQSEQSENGKPAEKRKPKKLEVRSGKEKGTSGNSQDSKSEEKPKRKPPKLEVRSKSSSKPTT
jgi:hypothetical protein